MYKWSPNVPIEEVCYGTNYCSKHFEHALDYVVGIYTYVQVVPHAWPAYVGMESWW